MPGPCMLGQHVTLVKESFEASEVMHACSPCHVSRLTAEEEGRKRRRQEEEKVEIVQELEWSAGLASCLCVMIDRLHSVCGL